MENKKYKVIVNSQELEASYIEKDFSKGFYNTKLETKIGYVWINEGELESLEIPNWIFTGDIDPIEHGGLWLKHFTNDTYDLVSIHTDYDGTVSIYTGSIDISDDWIEQYEIEEFGDVKKEIDLINYVASVISYYGIENFATELYADNINNEEQIKEVLNSLGIEI